MPELNITDDEAAMLAAVLAYVGGSPYNSPREHERSLASKLGDLGYEFTEGKAKEFHSLIDQTGELRAEILFKNYPDPFVPGYFRATWGSDPHNGIFWRDTYPGKGFERVTVTPVRAELSEEDLDSLPVGAKVRDRDADTWTKAPNGYWSIYGDASTSSGYVHERYNPIYLVSE